VDPGLHLVAHKKEALGISPKGNRFATWLDRGHQEMPQPSCETCCATRSMVESETRRTHLPLGPGTLGSGRTPGGSVGGRSTNVNPSALGLGGVDEGGRTQSRPIDGPPSIALARSGRILLGRACLRLDHYEWIVAQSRLNGASSTRLSWQGGCHAATFWLRHGVRMDGPARPQRP
jgi:hypothetical protein